MVERFWRIYFCLIFIYSKFHALFPKAIYIFIVNYLASVMGNLDAGLPISMQWNMVLRVLRKQCITSFWKCKWNGSFPTISINVMRFLFLDWPIPTVIKILVTLFNFLKHFQKIMHYGFLLEDNRGNNLSCIQNKGDSSSINQSYIINEWFNLEFLLHILLQMLNASWTIFTYTSFSLWKQMQFLLIPIFHMAIMKHRVISCPIQEI